jgi:hypothetical protein
VVVAAVFMAFSFLPQSCGGHGDLAT